jgi:hypothetical protein
MDDSACLNDELWSNQSFDVLQWIGVEDDVRLLGF